MDPMSKTTAPVFVMALSPRQDEATKPSELIRITGHQNLSLAARRAITLLWHNAHTQGIEPGKDYVIEIDSLIGSDHKGHQIVEDAVVALMQSILTVRHPNGSTTRVQFLGGNDLGSLDRAAGTLTYSFDKRLVEILKDSVIWGKISLPVLVSLSSKYSISLYENVAQMSGLTHKTYHLYSLEEFRSMLGVEPNKYATYGALNQSVLSPALQEINALAPFNVALVPIKAGRKIATIRLSWWLKDMDEIKKAWKELQQPKFGRRARISDQVSYVLEAYPSLNRTTKRARKLPKGPPDSL
jgi:hypothetical protein